MKTKSYIVTAIEFDFEDSMGEISIDDQKFITEKTGWCIKSISFEPNRPHALTSYM